MQELEKYKIDKLDKEIIAELVRDAKVPIAKLAEKMAVAVGTIHARIEKLKKANIITGTHIKLNYRKVGLDVCCFIGINVVAGKDVEPVLKNLNYLDEVVEGHYTTGSYSIFIKVITSSIEDLQKFLYKIRLIKGVQSTETLISLGEHISREAII